MTGPDAPSYLQAMVSNDVEALGPGEACEALLLTPKARVIAPLVVLRRAPEDYLLLTEPGLGDRVRATLMRSRFAAKCAIEPEAHASVIVLGGSGGIPTADYGLPAVELLDSELEPTVADEELELLRIRAGTPRWEHELDDRVLPAEAGLEAACDRLREGLLSGPGADCPAALPRPRQPNAAAARRRRRRPAGARCRAGVRGEGGRSHHELGSRPGAGRRGRARLRAGRGPRRTPSSSSGSAWHGR